MCAIAAISFSCVKGNDGTSNLVEEGSIVIDVRTAGEYGEGHLANAINIPHGEIAERIADHAESKAQKIVLYCRSGYRAGVAEKALVREGYTAVVNAGSYAKLKDKERKSTEE